MSDFFPDPEPIGWDAFSDWVAENNPDHAPFEEVFSVAAELLELGWRSDVSQEVIDSAQEQFYDWLEANGINIEEWDWDSFREYYASV